MQEFGFSLHFIDTNECKKECISRKCIQQDKFCMNTCCQCGKTTPYNKIFGQIIGGHNAKVRYPWMVSINNICDNNFNIRPDYRKLPWVNACGASMLSSRNMHR